MGILYWLLVWIFMIGAFVGAWSFIVKGCEALDKSHPSEEGSEASHESAH